MINSRTCSTFTDSHATTSEACNMW